jgi:hypothetical protein
MSRYFLATGLVGFRSSTLRVRETERRDGYSWVVTADLLDAGTKLVLDESQVVTPADEPVVAGFRHRDGLVTLAGAL